MSLTPNKKTTRGIALGTFDLFHAGHVYLLQRCKAQCDHLTVALNSDDFATRYKKKPICTLPERKAVLGACKYVDRVVINARDEDAGATILQERADIVFHGDDWPRESLMKQLGVNEGWLTRNKVSLVYLPYTPGVSTSEITKRIQARK